MREHGWAYSADEATRRDGADRRSNAAAVMKPVLVPEQVLELREDGPVGPLERGRLEQPVIDTIAVEVAFDLIRLPIVIVVAHVEDRSALTRYVDKKF